MCMLVMLFFFKQKTAYELRISDWSSDVCSSDLGVRLLHRTTRKVTPTEIGRTFVQTAERIIAELQEAEAEAAADKLVVRGLLRVNVPVSFGTSENAPILNDLSNAHPDLTIDLGVNDRLVVLEAEGWAHAIRIRRIQDSTMIERKGP